MSRILIVEDEKHLADGLRFNLEIEGYSAEMVETGEEAIRMLTGDGSAYSLMVLDVMLPGIDGFTVMSTLRNQGVLVPTLMLTARGHAEDVLRGFEAGADDYLPKPFELPILLARIKGLLRRSEWNRAPAKPVLKDAYSFEGRTIDFGNLQLRDASGRTIPLTLMEANLLRYLVEHEGQVVSRRQILENVWGLHEDTDTRAIDNFVVRLRRHIEDDPANPKFVLTVRGVGYRFVSTPGST